jgi:hypothetical protein
MRLATLTLPKTNSSYSELLLFFKCCPSSGILKNYRTQLFGNWICFRPQVRGEIPTLLGLLERTNLTHWTQGTQQSRWLSSPLDGNRSRFQEVVCFSVAVLLVTTSPVETFDSSQVVLTGRDLGD